MYTDELLVVESVEEANRRAFSRVITALEEALNQRGEAWLVVAGGSTFTRLYQLFSEDRILDWTRVHLVFGDERCVAPESEESNFKMVSQAWLQNCLEDAGPIMHRMQGELAPTEAISNYIEEIHSAAQGTWPTFDVVLLGIGADGHTASLFPSAFERIVRDHLLVAETQPDMTPFVQRITLTQYALNQSRLVLFMSLGEAKADITQKVLHDQFRQYPASFCRADLGSTVLITDQNVS
jgi:6-phosphogluconolactonase